MQYAFEMKEKVKHSYLDQVLVNSLVNINRLCDEFIVSIYVLTVICILLYYLL